MLNVTVPLYSLEKLREMASDDDIFIEKMIQMFLEQAPAMAAAVAEAYSQMDFAKVKSVAHKLKPSLDFMGIYDLLEDVKEIEQLALAGEPGDRLKTLINKLNAVMDEACDQLREELN